MPTIGQTSRQSRRSQPGAASPRHPRERSHLTAPKRGPGWLVHGARWALVASVVAMAAATGARADVYPIDLAGGQAAEDDAAASVILFRFGGDGGHPNLALVFDRKEMPAALVGNPSALAEAIALAPGAGGVSPYDAFGDVISVPHSAVASAFYFLSPEVTRRSKFANAVWAINDFFESFDFLGSPASSRLASPLAADAAQAVRSATSRLTSAAPALAPPSPSSDKVWNNWGCLWDQSVSDPWKQPASGPC